MSPDEVADIYRAYLFGAEAHQGQKRESGEAYIFHPLTVARILAELRMDPPSIIAAILHDVIEDTPTAKEQLAKTFGEEVAELVDGVSKLTHIEFETKAEAQAENFRKMMLAMVNDIRVIDAKTRSEKIGELYELVAQLVKDFEYDEILALIHSEVR